MEMHGYYSSSKRSSIDRQWTLNEKDIYHTLLFAAAKVVYQETKYYPSEYQKLASLMVAEDATDELNVFIYDDIDWSKEAQLRRYGDEICMVLNRYQLTRPRFAFKDFVRNHFKYARIDALDGVDNVKDYLGLVRESDSLESRQTLGCVHRTMIMQGRMLKPEGDKGGDVKEQGQD